VIKMTVTLRVQRSRGALTGFLLVLLGIWGAMVPFVGPYFHYAYTPDTSWTYTSGRMYLEILPGVAAILGGLAVMMTAHRAVAILGAWLAAVAGAWFAAGGVLSVLWTTGAAAGTPVGTKYTVMFEQIGFFTGLGIVIVFVAAVALGRFTVVAARDGMVSGRKDRLAQAPSGAGGPAPTGAPDRSARPRVSLVPAWLRSKSGQDSENDSASKTPAKTS
jgi:hypothetical protein